MKRNIKVSKFDAARRQLLTAILLWFNDGDPVSIHTLACAAYEIIHAVSRQRNPKRDKLLFDSLAIKEERRSEFNIALKNPANFFKHANKDGEATIDFSPAISEMFMLFAIYGIEYAGEKNSDTELAFLAWFSLHSSELLSDEGREFLIESIPVKQLEKIRSIPKHEFLQAATAAIAMFKP